MPLSTKGSGWPWRLGARPPSTSKTEISSLAGLLNSAGAGCRFWLRACPKIPRGPCFRAKGRMARRDEGEYPPWIFD